MEKTRESFLAKQRELNQKIRTARQALKNAEQERQELETARALVSSLQEKCQHQEAEDAKFEQDAWAALEEAVAILDGTDGQTSS